MRVLVDLLKHGAMDGVLILDPVTRSSRIRQVLPSTRDDTCSLRYCMVSTIASFLYSAIKSDRLDHANAKPPFDSELFDSLFQVFRSVSRP